MSEPRGRWIVLPDGLLPEDNEPIRIVDASVREVWEARPAKRTPRQMAALRKRALDAIADYRSRRVAREADPPSDD